MNQGEKRSILFCIHTLGGGGAEKLLIDILQRIDYEKMNVDLCVLTRTGGVYFDAIPKLVQCFIYEDTNSLPPKEYDVEVAFLEGHTTKIIALHQSDTIKIAWVHIDLYTYHWTGYSYKNNIDESMCYAMMDQIIFVSQTAMQQFEKLFPEITVHKKVIYNLIDKQGIILKSQEYVCPFKKTKLTLCSMGRLEKQKGFTRLIPVLSKLKTEGFDFHYLIIGEGHERAAIQKLMEEHELEDTVFLTGFQQNPYPWLKTADVFVSVSLVEGFPLVVGEALSLGKPVLATNVSGVVELLDHGKYGMLVDLDDDSICNGLKTMMDNESQRKLYTGKAETRSTADIFNLEKNMNHINDLLYNSESIKTSLNRIADRLIIDNNVNNDPGLLYGKMGKAIFFFHYYALTANTLYEDYAKELINEAIGLIHKGTSVSYETGLAGIGVGLEYLAKNQFIEGEMNDILVEVDNRMYEVIFIEHVSNFSLLNGYMGFARYFMYRLFNPENIHIQKETLITKSLDHILYVINSKICEIESYNEKLDIYRFLHDIKPHPFYNRRATICLNKYFNAHYYSIEHVRKNFSYLKTSPVNEYIRDCFNLKYFDITTECAFSHNGLNVKGDPHFLNGIISDGLLLATIESRHNYWMYLL